ALPPPHRRRHHHHHHDRRPGLTRPRVQHQPVLAPVRCQGTEIRCRFEGAVAGWGVAVEFRTVAEEEAPAYFRTISAGFGSPGSSDDDLAEWQTVAEYDQCFAALDGDRFVGGASAYSFEMTLPGGGLTAIGGVSNVAVLPTHRRQGVLTGLLARQLDDLAERGRPLAALNASESHIYRRFGYGLATDSVSVEIDTRHTDYLGELPPGRLHLVSVEEARQIFPAFYERWRRTRTGSLSRSDA